MIRWLFLGVILVGALVFQAARDTPPVATAQDSEPTTDLVIQTIPPIPGLTFELGSIEFQADEAGVATLPYVSGRDPQEPLRFVDRFGGADSRVRATFTRWCCGLGQPDAQRASLPSGSTAMRAFNSGKGLILDAGFSLEYLIQLEFVDLAGRPVDPSLISSISMKSRVGEKIEVDPSERFWALGQRVQPTASRGLFEKEVDYSINEVIVDGSNVVNRSQQRFFPSEVQSWRIELLFYSARFKVRDAIFRFPTGSSISLEFPDGHVEQVSLDDQSGVELDALPRGDYNVSVNGPGLSISRPVRLSRNQDMELIFISFLDIAVVGLLGLLFTVGLVLLGRPGLRKALVDFARRDRIPKP